LDVQLATHALSAGFRGADLAKAVAVGLAESAGDPNALCVNPNGTRDEGLWQINNVHGLPSTCAFDPQCNASEAYVLYRAGGGTFDDWASYWTGLYLRFVERGEAAVRTLGPRAEASPFVCPVDEPRSFGDAFGAPRDAEGARLHAGTDIVAPTGTPIRAPFDGTAVASSTPSGGLAVKVYGVAGWVSNAHLSAYGTLGPVAAGTIIGYVGNTGDAAGLVSYDYFEWHPKIIPLHPRTSLYGATLINGAIDPYPLLKSVCG
jgi:murein DD-endopeptidase MepM/ murein hydrolase activator NlpD